MNYYDILEISRDSELITIKKAYKRLAMKWHPDKNPNNKIKAEEEFKKISNAYQTLSDPVLRQKYDLCGETPNTFTSPDELFDQLFSNLDPALGGFLSDTLTRITKSFIEDKNKSVMDVFNSLDKKQIIKDGSNAMKEVLLNLNKKNISAKKSRIYNLKLNIDQISNDADNEIGIDIKFARDYTHIELQIDNNDTKKNYTLSLDYIEHIIRFENQKFTFLLVDKFPPGYSRYKNQDLILEYKLGTNNIGQKGILFNYPYYKDENLEFNVIFSGEVNLVKIEKKGLLRADDSLGDLYIIFNYILEDIQESPPGTTVEEYHTFTTRKILECLT